MIREVVELQDTFNSLVDEEWRNKQYKWNRYVWVECAELMESLDFKHWKHQDIDWENVKVELVDILHFVLSSAIGTFGKDVTIEIVKKANNNISRRLDDIEEFRGKVDELVYLASSICVKKDVTTQKYQTMFEIIFQLWDSVFLLYPMYEYVSIFRVYIVKNVLNKFRQDNGYKEGNYKKIWNGVEDNVVAMEQSRKFTGKDGLFDFVYAQLSKEYQKVLSNG